MPFRVLGPTLAHTIFIVYTSVEVNAWSVSQFWASASHIQRLSTSLPSFFFIITSRQFDPSSFPSLLYNIDYHFFAPCSLGQLIHATGNTATRFFLLELSISMVVPSDSCCRGSYRFPRQIGARVTTTVQPPGPSLNLFDQSVCTPRYCRAAASQKGT